MKIVLSIISLLTTTALARIDIFPPEIPNSHLICRKAKNESFDGKVIKANFRANQWQRKWGLKGCKIKTEKVEFCVPATKFLEPDQGIEYPWNTLDVVYPQVITNDFICYIMKCNGQDNVAGETVKVADQFGVKKLKLTTKKDRYKVCVPAWKLDADKRPIVMDLS